MLRKSYASLPRWPETRSDLRRSWVRCGLSLESGALRVDHEELAGLPTPEDLASFARRMRDQILSETPRFLEALREYSANHLLENVAEGLLQLRSREIEGFSMCPLITETIHCRTDSPGAVTLEIRFCAATLTFYVDFASYGSSVLQAHEDQLELYRTYYRDVLLVYVRRQMEEKLRPSDLARTDESDGAVTEALCDVLSGLHRLFPLESFQERLVQDVSRTGQKSALIRRLCREMREEARKRLKF